MKKKEEMKFYDRDQCPSCGSKNTTQTACDGDCGVDMYVCNECGCEFGN